jgi:23S rRNA G2445 N2-methylase RlmL
MKAAVIGQKGFESVMQTEVKELIGKDSTVSDSVIEFEVDSYEELCKLVYFGQSFVKAMLALHSFEFKELKDITSKKIEHELLKDRTFKVTCKRVGEHSFSSSEIMEGVGANVDCKVDMENPDVIIAVHVYDNKCYIGIDFSGIDLSKRDYKIFPNPAGVKGTTGYALVRIAGWKSDESLLDPFCKDGTICIEACAYGKGVSLNKFRKDKLAYAKLFDHEFEEQNKEVKIYGYDRQLANIKSGQKNARIIGLHKDITFSRVDVEWLDTKFGKGEVDKIVTCLPYISKRTNAKEVEKEIKEFMHQAAFVLKGKAVVLAKDLDIIEANAEKEGMKISEKKEVEIGKEKFYVIVIEK